MAQLQKILQKIAIKSKFYIIKNIKKVLKMSFCRQEFALFYNLKKYFLRSASNLNPKRCKNELNLNRRSGLILS